jgi:hypothetical protein
MIDYMTGNITFLSRSSPHLSLSVSFLQASAPAGVLPLLVLKEAQGFTANPTLQQLILNQARNMLPPQLPISPAGLPLVLYPATAQDCYHKITAAITHLQSLSSTPLWPSMALPLDIRAMQGQGRVVASRYDWLTWRTQGSTHIHTHTYTHIYTEI